MWPASAHSRSSTTTTSPASGSPARRSRAGARDLALPRAPAGRRRAGARPGRRVDRPRPGRPSGARSRPRDGTALHLKDDTRNPTLSFKDRVVAVATARAVEFGFDTLACASTGNLAGATAAAAAAAGLRAFVFVPADLEPAKVEHALSYGATVVRVDGTYDDINRLSLEIADEEGWAFVNVNLRPFYAEGSKTIAFEVAEQLGWRLPDVLVGPIASGSMFTKIAKGFEELAEIGLVERKDVRFVGGQPEGCSPVATAFAEGVDEIRPVRTPDTIVRSLAIGSPADGGYALDLARRTGGSIESIPDAATADAIRRTAANEGIFVETAGGVTVAAVEAARARGVIRDGDEVVAILSGNGVKTRMRGGSGWMPPSRASPIRSPRRTRRSRRAIRADDGNRTTTCKFHSDHARYAYALHLPD